MLTFGRTGRQSGILHRKDAAGHQVWTHLSWVRLMEPSLITQKTSSPPHPLTRLQSVAPGKVCRGNPEFSGSLLEDELPQQYAAGRHNWRIREHRSKKLGAKAQPTSNCAAGTEHVPGLNIPLQARLVSEVLRIFVQAVFRSLG